MSIENKKSRLKILLAEKDFDMLTLLRRYLTTIGYEAFITTNGVQAVDLARKIKPDLIILEIKLPGLNGLEVCRQVRSDEMTRDTSIMFLTAHGEKEVETQAFEAGAIDFMTKPFIPEILNGRIQIIFRNRGLIVDEDALEIPTLAPPGKTYSRPSTDNPKRTLEEWAGSTKPTISLVLTDIIGSTGLAIYYGDEAWVEVLIQHFNKARELRSQYDSYEIKLIGDAYMAVFRTAEAALEFCEDFVLNPGHDVIEIRAAVHTGPVRVNENDIYGLMVNKTQRLLSNLENMPGVVVSDHAHSAIISSLGQVGQLFFDSFTANLRSFGEEKAWKYQKYVFNELLKDRHDLIQKSPPFGSGLLPEPRSSKLKKDNQ